MGHPRRFEEYHFGSDMLRFLVCRMRAPCAYVFPETLPRDASSLRPIASSLAGAARVVTVRHANCFRKSRSTRCPEAETEVVSSRLDERTAPVEEAGHHSGAAVALLPLKQPEGPRA